MVLTFLKVFPSQIQQSLQSTTKKPFNILKTITAQTGSTDCIYLIFKKVHPMRISLSILAGKAKGLLHETPRPRFICGFGLFLA